MPVAQKTKTPPVLSKAQLPESMDRGPLVQKIVDTSPATMQELMNRFVKNRSYTDRCTIRMEMKALLDLVGVDSVYPSIPKADNPHAVLPNPARQNEEILGDNQ